MLKIFFTDLDDTLFQSHGKAAPGSDWRPAAFLGDSSPISYQSPVQQQALALFEREMLVIPVTARNHDAFQRVDLRFPAEAIINYGGTILEANGDPDAAWHARSSASAHKVIELLERWVEGLEREATRLEIDVSIRLITDFGLPFYIVAKARSGEREAAIGLLREAAARLRLRAAFSEVRIHANGNNLAILPKWLDKGHAVAYLIERYRTREPALMSFGMGDSLIDLGFMAACDYMIVPAGSQIAASMERRAP